MSLSIPTPPARFYDFSTLENATQTLWNAFDRVGSNNPLAQDDFVSCYSDDPMTTAIATCPNGVWNRKDDDFGGKLKWLFKGVVYE